MGCPFTSIQARLTPAVTGRGKWAGTIAVGGRAMEEALEKDGLLNHIKNRKNRGGKAAK